MVKVEKSGVYIKIISPSLERVLKIMNLTVREKLAWFSSMQLKSILNDFSVPACSGFGEFTLISN